MYFIIIYIYFSRDIVHCFCRHNFELGGHNDIVEGKGGKFK